MALAGGFWMFAVFGTARAGGLPKCDSADATVLVGRVITEAPAVQTMGVEYVRMTDVEEQEYDPDAKTRSCRGTLMTTAGEDVVSYTIRWQDEATRQFQVEAQVIN